MLFKEINEAVTMNKLNKLHKQFLSKMANDASIKDRMMNLNIDSDDEVENFCEDLFGSDIKGFHINTKDERKKLLRRIYKDYKTEHDNDFMRKDFSGDLGTF